MDSLPALLSVGLMSFLIWRFAIRPIYSNESTGTNQDERPFSKEEFEQCRDFLINHHYSYYHQLNESNKIKFVVRTMIILREKTFIAENHFPLDYEHKVILSSTLAQLTFGLLDSYYTLPRFRAIHIHPHTFYSKLINHEVKGLTVGNGRIFLSWNDFRKGYENGSDKVNLALHEFAHALEMELKAASDDDFSSWQYYAQEVMSDFQEGKFGSFRSYASTNIHELWATTVETFFEAPHAFKRDHAQLYAATVKVLNQDPTRNSLPVV